MPDLAMPDFAMPDLAMPDFAKPDLAMPDLVSRNCVTSLAGVGLGDFAISFRLTTSVMTTSWNTLLFQRQACGHGTFWDVTFDITAGIAYLDAETDGGPYTYLHVPAVVNDGQPHDIVVKRVAGTLSMAVDGRIIGSAPSGASLGTLPPLGVGSGDPCEGGSDPRSPLAGTVTNVCLSKM